MAFRSLVSMLVLPCLATAAQASFTPRDAAAAEEHPISLPEPAAERGTGTTPKDDDRAAYPLYFRISAGAGVVGIDMHPEAGYEDYSVDGATVGLDLLVGVSPYRGATLGGALLLDVAPSMSLASSTESEADSSSPMAIGMLGPFFDGFPEPDWGLHLGASVGFAALSVHPLGFSRHPLYGLGGAAWAGQELWVGKNWSMGAAVRVLHTFSGDEAGEFDFEAASLATSLMLTAMHQ